MKRNFFLNEHIQAKIWSEQQLFSEGQQLNTNNKYNFEFQK